MAARPPITAAIDRVVREVIAPSLKTVGFKRRGRTWTHVSETVHRGLTVQRSDANISRRGRFTLNLRLAFLELGDEPFVTPDIKAIDIQACNAPGGRLHRVGELIAAGRDHWWEIHDAHEDGIVDAFVRSFARDWNQQVLPVVESSSDARRFCVHLLQHSAFSGIVVGFLEAERLQDPDLVDALYDRALHLARQANPWPLTDDSQWVVTRLPFGNVGYSTADSRFEPVFRHWGTVARLTDRLARTLEGPNREPALDVLRWFVKHRLPTPYASPPAREEAQLLAAQLGVTLDELVSEG